VRIYHIKDILETAVERLLTRVLLPTLLAVLIVEAVV
jgi:hypothetical protein